MGFLLSLSESWGNTKAKVIAGLTTIWAAIGYSYDKNKQAKTHTTYGKLHVKS